MIESSGSGYGGPEYGAGAGGSGYGGPEYGAGSGGSGYGWYPPPPPPPKRGGGGILSHLGVAVLAAAVAVGATLAIDRPGSTSNASASSPNLPGASAVPQPGSSSAAATPSATASGSASGLQAVVNKVEPGTVLINSTVQYQNEQAAGTGMVINSDGLVLTNNHVIEDSTKLSATIPSTGKTYSATVVGYDETGDVALIQLQDASNLTTIPIGDSSSVKSGASVVALGNAEGGGTLLPAAGTITGLNQQVTASDQGGTITSETLKGMLETNAGIVSGDSGGPLSNSSGQVIGMDTAGSSGQGTSMGGQAPATDGFAIPINTALSIARQIASGKPTSTISIGYPPFIGIFFSKGSDSNPQDQAQQYNDQFGGGGFGGSFGGFGQSSCVNSSANLQPLSQVAPAKSGAMIEGVICNSPSASAGLGAGSVITAVNGKAVSTPDQLANDLAPFKPGDSVTIGWTNLSGHSTTSTLHLVAGPPM
jgi:S1-C subfamily serine protease